MSADSARGAAEQLQWELAQFKGRNQTYYPFPFENGMVFTEGVRHLVWRARARWLLADIAFAQGQSAVVRGTMFQVWKLGVGPERRGSLRCEDGNGHSVYTITYASLDFPLEEITLFVVSSVIYLPSEH